VNAQAQIPSVRPANFWMKTKHRAAHRQGKSVPAIAKAQGCSVAQVFE
jgi:hypothetical protein